MSGMASFDSTFRLPMSDLIASSNAPDIDTKDDHDYWLGKMAFRYMVAEIIFPQIDGSMRYASLDSKYEELLQNFNYSSQDDEVKQEGESCASGIRHTGSCTSYLTELGSIMSRGSSSSQQLAKQKLSEEVLAKWRPRKGDFDVGQTPTRSLNGDDRLDMRHSNGSPHTDIARYTMDLKEYADTRGQAPAYDFEQLSLYPSAFVATVMMNGMKYRGEGGSKKIAKHEASRKACEGLGL